MVSGDSYFPNDSDFGDVEPHAKGKAIYKPTDWYVIIAHLRTKKPFTVIQMNFYLQKLWRKKCLTVEPMNQIFQYLGYKFNGCNTEDLKPIRYYTKQH